MKYAENRSCSKAIEKSNLKKICLKKGSFAPFYNKKIKLINGRNLLQ